MLECALILFRVENMMDVKFFERCFEKLIGAFLS